MGKGAEDMSRPEKNSKAKEELVQRPRGWKKFGQFATQKDQCGRHGEEGWSHRWRGRLD